MILLLSIWGISRISYDTYLLDDISHNDPAYTSMAFFEDHFFGARPFEMAIEPGEGYALTDLEVLRAVDEMQEYLKGQTRISPFRSVVTYLKGINKLTHAGKNEFFVLPDRQEEVAELIGLAYLTEEGAALLNQVMNESRTFGRVSAQMSDIGSYAFSDLQDGLEAFVQEHVGSGVLKYRITGSPIIVDENVVVLREGLFTGLALAFGLVSLLMGLMFRSFRMMLIGVVPNVIPLVITAGLMGFFGITLRASTSIVFLIAFGVAVDDTIHFLGRLRLELQDGVELETAIRRTVLGTGKALVMTTVILLGGFAMLLTSNFGGTFAVGLFTGLTLLVALFSDLLLLPVLVRWSGVGNL